MELSDAEREEASAMLRRDALQREADLQAIMKLPEGRRFMVRMLDLCHWTQASYTGEPSGRPDAYNEGRRSVAIRLNLELMRVTPREWAQMHIDYLQQHALDLSKRPTPANRKETPIDRW